MGNFKNVYDVLSDIDIDCTALAYDGNELWALERARFALNTKMNVVDKNLYGVRGAPNYEKYLQSIYISYQLTFQSQLIMTGDC